MELERTKQVEDIQYDFEVNAYLEVGWVLIGFYTTDHGEVNAPSAKPHYILAWQNADKGPEYPAKYPKRELPSW